MAEGFYVNATKYPNLFGSHITHLFDTSGLHIRSYARYGISGLYRSAPVYIGAANNMSGEDYHNEYITIDDYNRLFEINMTNVKLTKGTASKYYGTDVNKNLVPMTDPDTFWKRTANLIETRVAGDSLKISSTTANAIQGTSTNSGSSGILGWGGTLGVTGIGTSVGVTGQSEVNPIWAINNDSGLDTIKTTLLLQRSVISGTPLAGLGTQIKVSVSNSVRTLKNIALEIFKYTTPTDGSEVSSFELWLMNTGTLAKKMELKGSGQLVLPLYGSGNITGTPVYSLQIDANGNLIEGSISDTFWKRTGAVLSPRTTNDVLSIINTTSASSIAATFDDGVPWFMSNNASVNTQSGALILSKSVSVGTPSTGFGVFQLFNLSNSIRSSVNSGRFTNSWTVATSGVETSSFEWWLLNSGALTKKMELTGAGQLLLSNYGAGTFAGTGVTSLQVDANGNIVEGPIVTQGVVPLSGILDWNGTKYAPYTTQNVGGTFDISTSFPLAYNRLNYNGTLVANIFQTGNYTRLSNGNLSLGGEGTWYGNSPLLRITTLQDDKSIIESTSYRYVVDNYYQRSEPIYIGDILNRSLSGYITHNE